MSSEPSDVVIVGAGARASLVAKELAARGVSVVVLEAGERFDRETDHAALAVRHAALPAGGVEARPER